MDDFAAPAVAPASAGADESMVEDVNWSHDRLCELVQGRAVFVRDSTGANLPIPPWLGAAADLEWHVDASESLAAVHPEDRMKVVEAFLVALEHPGASCYLPARELIDGQWFHVDLMWLNQLEHPDLNALVGTRAVMGAAAVTSAEAGDPGESGATSWVCSSWTGTERSARPRGRGGPHLRLGGRRAGRSLAGQPHPARRGGRGRGHLGEPVGRPHHHPGHPPALPPGRRPRDLGRVLVPPRR